MKLEKRLIGEVPVDSGQIMIVDPCYLDRWEANEYQYRTGLKKGKKVYEYRKDFDSWEQALLSEGGKTPNQLVADDDWECFTEHLDGGDFSYSGVCGVTHRKNSAGMTDNGLALASSTLWGDGCYNVYGYYEKGSDRPSRIEIIFE